VAIIWAIIWFGLLGMDSETLPVPLGLGVLTYWLLGKGIPSMWASFTIMVSEMFSSVSGVFSGFDNSILSYVEIGGYIVLWILAILAIGVIVWLAIARLFNRRSYPTQPPVQPPTTVVPPVQIVSPYPKSYQPGTNEFFHGTSLEVATEIMNTRLWMVGHSRPQGIYMSPDFDVANYYAESNPPGAIVVIKCHQPTQLIEVGNQILIYPIEDVVPYREYFKIPALTPIHVLNTNGTPIM